MPNGNAHRLIAALAVGGICVVNESHEEKITGKLFVNALLAALTTNLPDLIEPASNPHHRQFFHSVVFGSVVASSALKLYQWQTEEDWEKVFRQILLVWSGAYLIHLLADSFTPRGLSILGKV